MQKIQSTRGIKKKSSVFEISSETVSEKFTAHLVVTVWGICDSEMQNGFVTVGNSVRFVVPEA
jgi:hypothetical protein